MILCDCEACERKDLIELVIATTHSTISQDNFAPSMHHNPDSSDHWYYNLGHQEKTLTNLMVLLFMSVKSKSLQDVIATFYFPFLLVHQVRTFISL